jgi:hypothetical protein
MPRFLLGALQVERQEAAAAGGQASRVSKEVLHKVQKISVKGSSRRRCGQLVSSSRFAGRPDVAGHRLGATCHASCWEPCTWSGKGEGQHTKQSQQQLVAQGPGEGLVSSSSSRCGQTMRFRACCACCWAPCRWTGKRQQQQPAKQAVSAKWCGA